MIHNAEKMKINDENEVNRIFAKNELQIFCNDFLFSEMENNQRPNMNLTSLRKKIDECLEWVNNNDNASEKNFRGRYEKLVRELQEIEDDDKENKTILKEKRRSDHSSRIDSFTTKFCIEKGDKCLQLPRNLTTANEWFYRGYNIAKDKQRLDKMCCALQKIGLTYRLMLEDSSEMTEQEPNQLIFKGIAYLTRGIKLSEQCFVAEVEVLKMVDDIKKIIHYSFEEFNDGEIFHNKREMVDWMLSAIGNINKILNKDLKHQVLALLQSKLDSMIAEIDDLIEEGNTKEAMDLVVQTAEPIENILLIDTQEPNLNHFFALNLETIEKYKNHASALQQLTSSQAILDKLSLSTTNIDDKIDSAFIALDLVQEAKRNTTNRLKIFCQAKLLEGKIYLSLLPNKVKAKNCFKEVCEIAFSQQYVNSLWFNEAKLLFQRLKQEELDNEPKLDKTSILIELQEEIGSLDEASEDTDEEFMEFILEEFPPKHKGTVATPQTGSDRAKIKKAYIKLSIWYHPDKVNVDEFGLKYKVLCEEIAKRVNSRYERMK